MDRSDYERMKYAKRKALHQCVSCGTIDDRTLGGGATCASCAKRVAQSSKRLRAKRKAEHRCVRCGYEDERTRAGLTHCEWCAKKARYQRKGGAADA